MNSLHDAFFSPDARKWWFECGILIFLLAVAISLGISARSWITGLIFAAVFVANWAEWLSTRGY